MRDNTDDAAKHSHCTTLARERGEEAAAAVGHGAAVTLVALLDDQRARMKTQVDSWVAEHQRSNENWQRLHADYAAACRRADANAAAAQALRAALKDANAEIVRLARKARVTAKTVGVAPIQANPNDDSPPF